MRLKIVVKKNIHDMWKAYQVYPLIRKLNLPNNFGKYQYVYTSEKGRISLVKIRNAFPTNSWRWEICGGGFQSDEGFNSKKEALVKIRKLLG